MTISYFNAEKTCYCMGPRDEAEKYYPNFIEVDSCPGWEYSYNFDLKKWEKNSEIIQEKWEPERNTILSESGWTVEALDSPLSEEEKIEVLAYRKELMELFDGDVTTKTFPEVPECLTQWINK